MLQAYRYCGLTFLKFGKKVSPGVMYCEDDLYSGRRPAVELWRDGTVTSHDLPEGVIEEMARVRMPDWASEYKIKRFKSRS